MFIWFHLQAGVGFQPDAAPVQLATRLMRAPANCLAGQAAFRPTRPMPSYDKPAADTAAGS
jgi:hypothetical protein